MVKLVYISVLLCGCPEHPPGENDHSREPPLGSRHRSYLDPIDGLVAIVANNLRDTVPFRHLGFACLLKNADVVSRIGAEMDNVLCFHLLAVRV
jgi:hypothetical protein